jgi:hypothetical protein
MKKKNDNLDHAINDLKQRASKTHTPDQLIEETSNWLNRINADQNPQPRFDILLKIALAACVLFAIIIKLYPSTPLLEPATVAWAEVQHQTDNIRLMHYYEIQYRNSKLINSAQGWYKNGLIYYKKNNGNICIDDGINRIEYSPDAQILKKSSSYFGDLAKYQNLSFFKKLTLGVFKYKDCQVSSKIASYVDTDFLLYNFDTPTEVSNDIKTVSIFVGKTSKLPLQMKIYYKNNPANYDMFIFEYNIDKIPSDILKYSR